MIQELRKETERLKSVSTTQVELSKENAQLKSQNGKLELKVADMESSQKKMRHELHSAVEITKLFERMTGITPTFLGDWKFECQCTKNQKGMLV
jgi:hypothetical protein